MLFEKKSLFIKIIYIKNSDSPTIKNVPYTKSKPIPSFHEISPLFKNNKLIKTAVIINDAPPIKLANLQDISCLIQKVPESD